MNKAELDKALALASQGERNAENLRGLLQSLEKLINYYNKLKQQCQEKEDEQKLISGDIVVIKRRKLRAQERLIHLEAALKEIGYEEMQRLISELEKRRKSIENWHRGKERDRLILLEEGVPRIYRNLEHQKGVRKQLEEEFVKRSVTLWNLVVESPYLSPFVRSLPSVERNRDNIVLLCNELLKARRQARDARSLEDNIIKDRDDTKVKLNTNFLGEQHIFLDFACELGEDDCTYFRLEGKKINLSGFLDWLKAEINSQRKVIEDKERDLFENFIMQQVSDKIKRYVLQAQEWVEVINQQLKEHPLANSEYFDLKWREISKEGKGVNLNTVAYLLLQPALSFENQQDIISMFKQEINRIRELERSGQLNMSFMQALERLFDYRNWYEFGLFSNQKEYGRREIIDEGFGTRSGAQKALSLYIPLLAAAVARYEQARSDAPRIVGLDEAFAGVDYGNIREVYKFMLESKLSWIITSEKLSGEIDVLPGSITYTNRLEGDVFASDWYLWNGKRRVETEKPVPTVQEQLFA